MLIPMENQRIIIIITTIAILLCIPLIAMQFTNEVNWTLFDFVIMGILLSGVGLLLEFTIRKSKNNKQRLLFCAAIIILFLMVWAELAVGVFGTPFAGY